MKTYKKIVWEGDEAEELVLAATGRPFLIIVEKENGDITMRTNNFNRNHVIRLVKAYAENSKEFRAQLPDVLIELSKCLENAS